MHGVTQHSRAGAVVCFAVARCVASLVLRLIAAHSPCLPTCQVHECRCHPMKLLCGAQNSIRWLGTAGPAQSAATAACCSTAASRINTRGACWCADFVSSGWDNDVCSLLCRSRSFGRVWTFKQASRHTYNALMPTSFSASLHAAAFQADSCVDTFAFAVNLSATVMCCCSVHIGWLHGSEPSLTCVNGATTMGWATSASLWS